MLIKINQYNIGFSSKPVTSSFKLLSTMENVIHFLETSTIHGLNFIASSGRILKVFWILVVTAGFVCSGILIYQAFQDWEESPIKTTVHTQRIQGVRFPKVTVCPPVNTYTNLNYDLVMTQNMTLDNETRNELTTYALEELANFQFWEVFHNMSYFHEENRYLNWYHGATKIAFPFNFFHVLGNPVHYTITNELYMKQPKCLVKYVAKYLTIL